MNSRERVSLALDHQETDKVPVDLSGTGVSGIHASALTRLRKLLGLENRIVKVFEPMTMQGQVDQDLIDAIGCDVIGLYSPFTLLGYKMRIGSRANYQMGPMYLWPEDSNITMEAMAQFMPTPRVIPMLYLVRKCHLMDSFSIILPGRGT